MTKIDYDGLNRPKSRSYYQSDATTAEGTPKVTYTYDGDWKGALSKISADAAQHSTSYTHDTLGRVVSSAQTTAGAVASPFQYTYSLADQLTGYRFPGGKQLSYGLDSAGRLTSLTNTATSLAYVSGVSYNPDSTLQGFTMGNQLKEAHSYNDRAQLTNFSVGAAGATSLLNLAFYPCTGAAQTCATGNTGNVQSVAITVPTAKGATTTVTNSQTYAYDALNRLTSMAEAPAVADPPSSPLYRPNQTYGFTGTHNWYLATNDARAFAATSFTPTVATAFDPTNNRLGINSDGYDDAGRQTAIGGYNLSYDAENRITTSKLTASAGFSYDGLGQRVQKINCPGGENPCRASAANAVVTTFLYDAMGNLAVESTTAAASSICGTPTCYVSVDQVGSTRLITDSSGGVARRYD